MDADDDHLGYYDYNDEVEVDSCVHCGDECDDLNIIYYGINKDLKILTLAINPKPFEKIIVPEGYTKRYELICNECLKDEYNV